MSSEMMLFSCWMRTLHFLVRLFITLIMHIAQAHISRASWPTVCKCIWKCGPPYVIIAPTLTYNLTILSISRYKQKNTMKRIHHLFIAFYFLIVFVFPQYQWLYIIFLQLFVILYQLMIKIQQLFTSPGSFTWFRTILSRFSTNTNVIFECILILSRNIRYESMFQFRGFNFSLNSRSTKGIASTCMIFDWCTFQSKMIFRLTKLD